MPNFIAAEGFAIHGSETQPTLQIRQVQKGLTELFPREAPFLTLLSRTAAAARLIANKFEWVQRGKFQPHVTVTVEESASGTSLAVESTAGVTADTILLNPLTREQMKVATVDSATALTLFTRGGQGGGTASVLPVGTKLMILSAARIEGGAALDPIGIKSTTDYNYGQQAELTWSLTDRMRMVAEYGAKDVFSDAEMVTLREYRDRLNRSMLFGHRSVQSTSGTGGGTHGSWTMDGMEGQIRRYAENVKDAGGTFTYDELMGWLLPCNIFHASLPATYLGLCGPNVRRVINNWNLNRHDFCSEYSDAFGYKVSTIKGHNFSIALVDEAMFQFDSYYASGLMLINMDEVQHLVGEGMADQINREITGPKKDGNHTIKNQITGVHTLAIDRPQTHLFIENITS